MKKVMEGRRHKRHPLLSAFMLLIVSGSVFYLQFTGIGYRMTVAARDFREIDRHIYLMDGFSRSDEEILEVVAEARARVCAYFGNLVSDPVLILSDDPDTWKKLDGDHDTLTVVAGKAHSYISLSTDYFDVDIVAHEFTHAETHARLYQNDPWYHDKVPVWFDEGLALQNDYREIYGTDAYLSVSDGGKREADLEEMATEDQFYSGDKTTRRYRYIVSGHEIREWTDVHGKAALFLLLEEVGGGKSFENAYGGK